MTLVKFPAQKSPIQYRTICLPSGFESGEGLLAIKLCDDTMGSGDLRNGALLLIAQTGFEVEGFYALVTPDNRGLVRYVTAPDPDHYLLAALSAPEKTETVVKRLTYIIGPVIQIGREGSCRRWVLENDPSHEVVENIYARPLKKVRS